jgi:hypothetical protein
MFTGCWFEQYPASCIQVGISRGVPRGHSAGYRMYRRLMPGPWFASVSAEVYMRRYFDILSKLDPREVLAEILELAHGKAPILCCYESLRRPTQWCHRSFVSAWLADTLQLVVPEYGYENQGHGWAHPLLPRAHQREPLPLFEPSLPRESGPNPNDEDHHGS